MISDGRGTDRLASECHRKTTVAKVSFMLDRSIVTVNEDVYLADPSSVAGNLHSVGLSDENVSGNSGAGGDGGAWRPKQCW